MYAGSTRLRAGRVSTIAQDCMIVHTVNVVVNVAWVCTVPPMDRRSMKHGNSAVTKQHRANQSCPIRSKMYGGIPGGGGFSSTTEWEIGVQRMAEAAHCILGSLGKHGRGREWIDTLDAEQAHIEEETGIIRMVMEEYGKDLYTDRLHDGYYDDVDVAETVRSVQTAGPELVRQAQAMLNQWSAQENVPAAIHELASLTYMLLIETGDAADRATVDYPDAVVQNPYRDPKLVSAVQYLLDAVHDLYQDVEAVEQEEEADEESRTDRIMRILEGGVNTFVYRGHLYREAGFQGIRAARQQLNRFSAGRLTSKLWLAEKQKSIWRWSGDVVGSVNQEGQFTDKVSWHPLTGEVVLTYFDNHYDDIYRYGSQPDPEYLRSYVWQNKGTIAIVPWNPLLYEDVTYHDLLQLEDKIKDACYTVAEKFKAVLEPTLPPDLRVDIAGCSEKH